MFKPEPATPAVAAPANASWKAQGFINVYIEGKDGRRKIGALPLKTSSPAQRELLEYLESDPARAQKLAGVLQLEFKSAVDNGEGVGLQLPE